MRGNLFGDVCDGPASKCPVLVYSTEKLLTRDRPEVFRGVA